MREYDEVVERGGERVSEREERKERKPRERKKSG